MLKVGVIGLEDQCPQDYTPCQAALRPYGLKQQVIRNDNSSSQANSGCFHNPGSICQKDGQGDKNEYVSQQLDEVESRSVVATMKRSLNVFLQDELDTARYLQDHYRQAPQKATCCHSCDKRQERPKHSHAC